MFTKVNRIHGIEFYASNCQTNVFVTHENNKFSSSKIIINGSNNVAIIKKSPFLIKSLCADFASNSQLFIDLNFSCDPCEFWLRENVNILIGRDNMFSSQITFWTSDGHVILDQDGFCINKASDIVVGDHVCIGHGAKLLKSAFVNDGCVVGGSSIVTKQFFDKNSIIAGIPGKIIKNNINWNRRSPLSFKSR